MSKELESLTEEYYKKSKENKNNINKKDVLKKVLALITAGTIGVSATSTFKKHDIYAKANKTNQCYQEINQKSICDGDEKNLSTFQEVLNYMPEGIVLRVNRDDAKQMLENNYLLNWMFTNWNEERKKELENLMDGRIENGELISLLLGRDKDSAYYGVDALFQRKDGTPYELFGIDGARDPYFKGMFNIILFEMINSPTLNQKFFNEKTKNTREYLTLDSKLYAIVKEGLSTKTNLIADYLKNTQLIDEVKIFSEEKKDSLGNITTKFYLESKDRFVGKQELKLIEIDKKDYKFLQKIKEVLEEVEKRFSQKEISISYEENKSVIDNYNELIAEHLTHTISEGGTKNGVKEGDYLSDYPKELRVAQLLGYSNRVFDPKKVLWQGKVKTKSGTLDVKLYDFEFAGGKNIEGLSCEDNCKFKDNPAILFSEYQCPNGKYPAYIMNIVMKSDKKGVFLQVAPFLYDRKGTKNYEHFEALKDIYKNGVLEEKLRDLTAEYSTANLKILPTHTYDHNGTEINYFVLN
ncbi:MAG: hypothetical protein ACP5OZ_00260 [Candidatus Woesearchaeota archaeon]